MPENDWTLRRTVLARPPNADIVSTLTPRLAAFGMPTARAAGERALDGYCGRL